MERQAVRQLLTQYFAGPLPYCEISDTDEFASDAFSGTEAGGESDDDDREKDLEVERQCLAFADGIRKGEGNPNRRMTQISGVCSDDESKDRSEDKSDIDDAVEDTVENDSVTDSGSDTEELGHKGKDEAHKSSEVEREDEGEGAYKGQAEQSDIAHAIKHDHEIRLDTTNPAVKFSISIDLDNYSTRDVMSIHDKSGAVLEQRVANSSTLNTQLGLPP